ncbi:uncharacterized protein CANTADRAFT_7774 [Suhomyces tanzawaensis NRRL Y-17324]|uniref:Uncharacterized protein n=1 Tax=Suhomyces tanzawaensis NRRL Y-17324 TaxID=984487 RepID=A0A1E4SD30_9ASCO|nr:uncharacterized protein CANTADRAFT_7774 [Suhomyces tanzawaensis NRRL Y-17324]ODV77292.1 hypothetical protein CANTADRAFT_7774 [Suhomyces tanzawaensis NRRL Y-17324]
MSRLRKLDRAVLDTSSELLDSDDQAALIDRLSTENIHSYASGKRYLSLALLVQLPVVMYLEHHHNPQAAHAHLRVLLILLSNVLTLVNLREFAVGVASPVPIAVPVIVDVVNGIICCQLLYSLGAGWSLEKLYYLLPSINLGSLVLFRWWYVSTIHEVEALGKLTYKYKTV